MMPPLRIRSPNRRALACLVAVAAGVPFLRSGEGVDAADAPSTVLPGDVSWLGDASGGDGTADDFTQELPLGFVLMGPGSLAVIRVLLPLSAPCPTVDRVLASADPQVNAASEVSNHTNGTVDFDLPTVKVRAVGDWSLPHPFPIRVCDVRLESMEQRNAYNNNYFTLVGVKRQNLPATIPDDPQRFLFLSDTGLRSRPYNLGISCNSSAAAPPSLYGVPQCPANVTQRDVSPQEVRVDAQAIDDWPLPGLIKKAARQEPDVVIFAGGALYRQGPCPASASGVRCVGINGGGYAFWNRTGQAVPPGTVANFLPGRWGDNWFGWWADFFFPAKVLLKQAPWIVARGSDLESSCDAGGRGYWLLLSTDEYPNGTRAGDFCPVDNRTAQPFAVTFAQEQIIVMNRAMAEALDNSDLAVASGECPSEPTNQSQVVPTPANVTTWTDLQRSQFQEALAVIQNLSAASETNFLVSHRPLFGVYCSQSHLVSSDPMMEITLGGNLSTLDSISGVFSGRQKALQVMEFESNALPFQVTLGHGGSKIEDSVVDPDLLSRVALQAGDTVAPVRRSLSTNALHGFALMERNAEGSGYDLSFYNLDTVANAAAVLDHQLSIPMGSRFTPSEAPSGAPAPDGATPAPAPAPSTSGASSISNDLLSFLLSLLLPGGVGAASVLLC